MGVRLEFSPEQAEDDLAVQLAASDRVRFAFVRQHQYVPGRRFKADFAFPELRLLIEVQGGVYTGQAHGSVSGVLRDNERLNLATLHGWSVLRFTPDDVASGAALTAIEDYLEAVEERASFDVGAGAAEITVAGMQALYEIIDRPPRGRLDAPVHPSVIEGGA
ncbi:MAG: endonuclease domain-containing protein [Dehalococcoidia bacterium]